MNAISKYFKGNAWWKVTGVLITLMIIVISCSISIDSVDQADSIDAGETLPVTLHVTLKTNDSRSNQKFMVALLVPKVWNARRNASISFTSAITSGNQKMSAIAPGAAAPQANGRDWPTYIKDVIGSGGNLLAGWEWVAFYSNAGYNVGSNETITITVNIKIKVSQDNLSFKMGYLVGNNSDGLSDAQYYASAFPGCFRVFGEGDLIDFCNPQLSTVDPMSALENDIITLNFDGGIIDGQLSDASEVFLCLKGVTTNGDTLNICGQDSTTRLTSFGAKKWRIDIWPKGRFKLTAGQHLESLVYYFTDRTGSIKVGDETEPFIYTFKCSQ